MAIITMEDEQELVCDLWNGVTFNDLERPLTLISTARRGMSRKRFKI